MSNKIQGEGDYEAARRFNRAEQEFIKRSFNKRHLAEVADEEEIDFGDDDIIDLSEDDQDEGDDLEYLRQQGLFSRSEY
jgi:hypothetical protein